MTSFFTELKRRNVFRVAVLYVVTGWLVLQVADVVIPYFDIPDWTFRFILVLLAFTCTVFGQEDPEPPVISEKIRTALDEAIFASLVSNLVS